MHENVGAEDLVAWSRAFAFTQVVEVPIYRRLVPAAWGAAFAASAITHPFVWFAFPWAGDQLDVSWTATTIVSEAFAIAVEAVFFQKVCAIRWRRAMLVSLLANGTSVVLGLLARAAFGIV